MKQNANYKFDIMLSFDQYKNKDVANAAVAGGKYITKEYSEDEYDKNFHKIVKAITLKENTQATLVANGFPKTHAIKFKRNNEITPEILLNELINGHTMCNLFWPNLQIYSQYTTKIWNKYDPKNFTLFLNRQGKRNENFVGSYCVCIDIDNGGDRNKISIESIINKLHEFNIAPTLYHTSYSHGGFENGKPKPNKFRLIYVFDELITYYGWPISTDDFEKVPYINENYIMNMLVFEPVAKAVAEKVKSVLKFDYDDVSLRPAQYFNGTWFENHLCEYGCTNIIYNAEDFGISLVEIKSELAERLLALDDIVKDNDPTKFEIFKETTYKDYNHSYVDSWHAGEYIRYVKPDEIVYKLNHLSKNVPEYAHAYVIKARAEMRKFELRPYISLKSLYDAAYIDAYFYLKSSVVKPEGLAKIVDAVWNEKKPSLGLENLLKKYATQLKYYFRELTPEEIYENKKIECLNMFPVEYDRLYKEGQFRLLEKLYRYKIMDDVCESAKDRDEVYYRITHSDNKLINSLCKETIQAYCDDRKYPHKKRYDLWEVCKRLAGYAEYKPTLKRPGIKALILKHPSLEVTEDMLTEKRLRTITERTREYWQEINIKTKKSINKK